MCIRGHYIANEMAGYGSITILLPASRVVSSIEQLAISLVMSRQLGEPARRIKYLRDFEDLGEYAVVHTSDVIFMPHARASRVGSRRDGRGERGL